MVSIILKIQEVTSDMGLNLTCKQILAMVAYAQWNDLGLYRLGDFFSKLMALFKYLICRMRMEVL